MLETPPAPPPMLGVQRALVAWNTSIFAAWIVLPFAAAGPGWGRWLRGWLHLAAILSAAVVQHRYVHRRNPALLARRARIREGASGWDLAWNACFWPLLASAAVVAGLEVRRGASPLPAWTWPLGAALLAAGFVLSARAMAVNPFFEGVVRIQREAGHRTISDGPYRRLRHPGYAGLALWALATPLLLGSRWATAPALATVAWIVTRTALEDALLRRALPGYGEYARRVKRRLVPGVW